MFKGNVIIGQSGGPTCVINGSLAGVISEAAECKQITGVYGMRYGIEGFLQENIINLKKEGNEIVNLLRHIFLIGGNDTMDTIHRIEEYCHETGYELQGVGIHKTVDNDLYGTDHTPGYPSAARYVAMSVLQGGLLSRDMQKVDQFVIYQAVGRSAGWLVAASVMGKKNEADPPHIILMPERHFDLHKFLNDFETCYKKYGWVSIAVGEGVTYEDGTPISASRVTDKFSNVEFGAMGGTSAAMMLHRMISDRFKIRGEFQVVESLQMCGADRMSAVDAKEAFQCGVEAVKLIKSGQTGYMVSIEREKGKVYSVRYGKTPLEEVAIREKPMPDKYINAEGNFVTKAFVNYLKPLVGELPEYVTLKAKQVFK